MIVWEVWFSSCREKGYCAWGVRIFCAFLFLVYFEFLYGWLVEFLYSMIGKVLIIFVYGWGKDFRSGRACGILGRGWVLIFGCFVFLSGRVVLGSIGFRFCRILRGIELCFGRCFCGFLVCLFCRRCRCLVLISLGIVWGIADGVMCYLFWRVFRVFGFVFCV